MKDKLKLLFGIAIVILIMLGYVELFPYPLYYFEYSTIPIMSKFLSYIISFIIPIFIISKIFYNPGAQRTINPVNKKFIPYATLLIVVFVSITIWFYILNWITIQLTFLFYGLILPVFYSDLEFLFIIIFIFTILPLICLAVILPGSFAGYFKSLKRYAW